MCSLTLMAPQNPRYSIDLFQVNSASLAQHSLWVTAKEEAFEDKSILEGLTKQFAVKKSLYSLSSLALFVPYGVYNAFLSFCPLFTKQKSIISVSAESYPLYSGIVTNIFLK